MFNYAAYSIPLNYPAGICLPTAGLVLAGVDKLMRFSGMFESFNAVGFKRTNALTQESTSASAGF